MSYGGGPFLPRRWPPFSAGRIRRIGMAKIGVRRQSAAKGGKRAPGSPGPGPETRMWKHDGGSNTPPALPEDLAIL
jgi:hypothetical protein